MFGLFRAADAEAGMLARALDASWAMIEFSPDGTILKVNKAFLDATGYAAAELVGNHHSMLCPPEVAQSDYYRDFWRGLGQGKPVSGRFKRRDRAGDPIFLRASYMPLTDAGGKVVRVIKLAADVSSDAEAELDAQGKLQAISRNSPAQSLPVRITLETPSLPVLCSSTQMLSSPARPGKLRSR